jgi:hypothetical protein
LAVLNRTSTLVSRYLERVERNGEKWREVERSGEESRERERTENSVQTEKC